MSELASVRIDTVPCHTVDIGGFIEETRRLRADAGIRPRSITALNAHICNLARHDTTLRDDIAACRMITADGMSIVWFGRWIGGAFGERCNMTDALYAWMSAHDFPSSTALLVGGTAEQAAAAAETLNRDCPHLEVLASVDGFLDDAAILAALSAAPTTDFILVGLGTPRSERMLSLLSEAFPACIPWHIGGGTILHLADAVKRAPAWMRRSGLQWLHRLCMEPGRMWRRYLLGNTAFIAAMVRQRFRRG